MGRSSRKDAALTREHILDTAEVLFAKDGVSAVPLTTIAHQAGLTTGAVYWHFKDKDALLNALFERGYCSVAAMLFEYRANVGGASEVQHLEELCLRLFDHVTCDPVKTRLFRILLTNMELTSTNVLTRRFQWATRELQDTIRQRIESILFQPGGAVWLDIEQATMFLVIQIIGSVRFALMEHGSETAVSTARSCISAAVKAAIPARAK